VANGNERVRTFVKVALVVVVPVITLALAFCGIGAYLYIYNDRILPSIFIGGVDVSWFTRDEVERTLDLQACDKRGNDATVVVVFPDSSELIVTGQDVRLAHDARLLVDTAFSRGRGNGFVIDTAAFLRRLYDLYLLDAEAESYEVKYGFDMETLRDCVRKFTDNYNSVLEMSRPLVHDDRVVIVKGAGQVRASEFDVSELAFDGLLESLAIGYPVRLSYSLPQVGANTVELKAIRRSIFAQPLSAEYDPETKSISEGVVGVDFDYTGALERLNEVASGVAVSFDIEYSQPEVTREYLEGLLFRDLVGECVTQIAGSENRFNNIVLATDAINGVVLEPGEEFSFNRIVGRRTSERGYKQAPAFSGGQTVMATGGGICQVSSTIYSAIKDTDIHFTERHAHGQPVAYLPRGRDATVSWGTLDFRFVNNTEYPLRVDVEIDGRTLTAKVFGTLNNETAALGAVGELSAAS